MQDSSDDDMPIAQLAKKHKQAAPAVESDSDDDVLLTDLPKKVMPNTWYTAVQLRKVIMLTRFSRACNTGLSHTRSPRR